MADTHWTHPIREAVEQRLQRLFTETRARTDSVSPLACELVDAIAELTLRGGKRLRPAVLYAGCIAVEPNTPIDRIADAGAALEILQSYLLIHDDWMDGDTERRGAATVHVRLGERYLDPHLAAGLAVLAGDLASGYAWELLGAAPFPAARRAEAYAAFARMHEEVVLGQQLDLVGHPDVARMHHLKTGSYTVRGPLRLGALLGNATAAQLEALEAFGHPIGLAFQLRDDLLGTFGDRMQTGKPTGNDLRAGKHTALIAEARASVPAERLAPLTAVLGRRDATDTDVAAAVAVLEESGTRARIEQRLDGLLATARARLDAGPFAPQGRHLLANLVELLGVREH